MDSPSLWLNADSSIHVPDVIPDTSSATTSPSAMEPEVPRVKPSTSTAAPSSRFNTTSQRKSQSQSRRDSTMSNIKSALPSRPASRQPSPIAQRLAERQKSTGTSIPVISTTAKPNPFARRVNAAAKPPVPTQTRASSTKRSSTPTAVAPRPPLAPQQQQAAVPAVVEEEPVMKMTSAPVMNSPIAAAAPKPVPAVVEEKQNTTTASVPADEEGMKGFSGIDGESLFLQQSIHIASSTPNEQDVHMELQVEKDRADNLERELKKSQSVTMPSPPPLGSHTKMLTAVESQLEEALMKIADLQREKKQVLAAAEAQKSNTDAADATAAQIDDLNNRINAKEEELQTLQRNADADKAAWTEQVDAAAKKFEDTTAKLEQEKQECMKELSAAQQDIAALQSQLANGSTDSEQLQTELATLQKEVKELQQTLGEQTAQLGEKEVKLDFAQSELESLKYHIAQLQEEVAQKSTVITEMKSANSDLVVKAEEELSGLEKQKAEELEEKLSEAAKEHQEKMSKATSEFSAQLEELKNDFAAERSNFTEELEKAKDLDATANAQLKEELGDAKDRSAQLQSQLANLEEDFIMQKDEMTTQHQQQMALMEKQNSDAIKNTVDEHFQQMDALRQENTHCRVEIADLTNKVNLREGSANDAKAVQKATLEELMEAKQLCDSLRADRDSVQGRVAQLEKELDSRAQQNANMEKEEIDRYETQIRKLTEELNAAEREGREYKDETEEELTTLRSDLDNAQFLNTQKDADMRKEKMELMTSESEARATLAQMTRDLDAARTANNSDNKKFAHLEQELERTIQVKNDLALKCNETMSKFVAEEDKCRIQSQKLREYEGKIETLENLILKSNQDRRMAAMSPTPMAPRGAMARASLGSATPIPSVSRKTSRPVEEQQQGGLKEQSVNSIMSTSQLPMKKFKQISMHRKFTITGFKDSESEAIISAIRTIPGASYIESSSNRPVTEEVTHCIHNGALTLKLLTAATKGCWVLPKSYIEGSLTKGEWLEESVVEYGLRHKINPLLGKTIGFSDGFRSSKRYGTIDTVVKDSQVHQSMEFEDCDMVLCSSSDVNVHPGKGCKFDGFLNMLLPGVQLK